MTPRELVQRAKEKNALYLDRRNKPAYQKTMASIAFLNSDRLVHFLPAFVSVYLIVQGIEVWANGN